MNNLFKIYLVAVYLGIYWIQSAIDQRIGLFHSTDEAL